MMKFSSSVRFLLFFSLMTYFGKAIAFTFMAIYLSLSLKLSPKETGFILGLGLLFGALVSLYGGYLVDRVNRKYLLWGCLLMLSVVFFTIPSLSSPVGFVVVLSIANSAFAIIDITVKAIFSDSLPEDQRLKAFSARYLLANIGFAVGPFLGSAVASVNPVMPFWLSGAVAIVMLAVMIAGQRWLQSSQTYTDQGRRFVRLSDSLMVLRRDKVLILFTLGGILSAVIYARFPTYLSQYLATVSTEEVAYKYVALVTAVNAFTVILLQYGASKIIDKSHLFRFIVLGSMLFIISFVIFSISTHLMVWAIAIFFFSLGEIIVVPSEYLSVDRIAPNNLKGSYFAAQNLSSLGDAMSPIICGLILSVAAPEVMFYFLSLLSLGCIALYWFGYRTITRDRMMRAQVTQLP
jgi:MFS family permease